MSKKCLGCGAIMQYENKNEIGYINEKKYIDAKYCERCFKLINYGEYKEVVTNGEEYIDIYKKNTGDAFTLRKNDAFKFACYNKSHPKRKKINNLWILWKKILSLQPKRSLKQ